MTAAKANGKLGDQVLERARVHFDAQEVQVVEVPEWGEDGSPLLLYYRPMTLAEKRPIFPKLQKNDLEALADIVVRKALDADGERVFSIEHKRGLMQRADSDVVARIGQAMMGVSVETDDELADAEKN